MFKLIGTEYSILFDIRRDERFSVFMTGRYALQHFHPAIKTWDRVSKKSSLGV